MKHDGKVCMDMTMLIKEHQHLIDVLKRGTAAMREEEAAKQKAEMMRLTSRPMAVAGMMRPAKLKMRMEGDPMMHNYDK